MPAYINRIYRLLSLPTPRVSLYVSFVFTVIHCIQLTFVFAISGAIALRDVFIFLSVVRLLGWQK